MVPGLLALPKGLAGDHCHCLLRERFRVMRVGRAISAAVLVVGLVVSTPLAASASVAASSVSMADTPDFTPSKGKWRQYMLNMLGSVLGGSMPKGWRAEQIANQYQYNFGAWDDLNARLGIDGVRTNSAGEVVGIKYTNRGQGTYTDVVIDGMENQFTETGKKGGSGGKPLRAPATKPVKFFKLVGGVLTAYTAFEIGNMLGAGAVNALGGFFGYDAQAAVCGTTGGDIVGQALQLLSGQDCSMWNFDPEYTLNGDGGVTYSPVSYGGFSLTFQQTVTRNPGGNWYDVHCYTQTGSLYGTGYGLYSRQVGGGVTGHGSAFGGGASSVTCGNAAWAFAYGKSYTGSPTQMSSPAVWIAVSASAEPVASMSVTSGDPERYQECTVTYTDNSTSSLQGARYRESDGAIAPAPCPATPSGKTPRSVSISDNQVGDASKRQTVAEEDVSDDFRNWWEAYPECTTGGCKLDLYKKTGTSSVAVSCFDLEDGCAGWFEDPAKATTYTCRYGVHEVDLTECNVYAGLFEPGRVESGAGYVDPETGEWSGGQTSVKSGQKAFNANIQDPATTRNCDLSGMGFDPVGWVMRPVQCALEWAFVPRPVVAEVSFASVGTVWSGKPPGAIAAAVDAMAINASATGCSIATTYKSATASLVDACGGFMGGLATFTRIATVVLFAFAVFAKVRRQIAAMVNYNVGQD